MSSWRCCTEHWRDTHPLAPARRKQGGTTAHHRVLPDVHVHPKTSSPVLSPLGTGRTRRQRAHSPRRVRDRGTRPRRGPARKRCIAARARQRVRREAENGGLEREEETWEERTSFMGGSYTLYARVRTHRTRWCPPRVMRERQLHDPVHV
jgi:hypothetical protein